MKKLNKSGMTLMETVVALLILVLLVLAMDFCTNSALGVFNDSTFTADSATLSGILNTSLADILRYSEKVDNSQEQVETVVFTNYDYGVRDAYFPLALRSGTEESTESDVIQMNSLDGSRPRDLVNTGAYPNLEVLNFSLSFNEEKNCYTISYTIQNKEDPNLKRDVEYVVRRIETGY